MWDQVVSNLSQASSFMPWVSLAAGLGGGLHCVGMCGGLVTASCDGAGDVARYQVGRLIGYLALGCIAGILGESFQLVFVGPWPSFLGGLVIGGLLIFWGVENWRGRKAELPFPLVLTRWYRMLWGRVVSKRGDKMRPFLVGLISIFLPCGLLYGILIGAVAMQDPLVAITSMTFFWLGTLPSMVFAPQVLRRILTPLRSKAPKVYGMGLLLVGLATIGWRVGHLPLVQDHAYIKAMNARMECH